MEAIKLVVFILDLQEHYVLRLRREANRIAFLLAGISQAVTNHRKRYRFTPSGRAGRTRI